MGVIKVKILGNGDKETTCLAYLTRFESYNSLGLKGGID